MNAQVDLVSEDDFRPHVAELEVDGATMSLETYAANHCDGTLPTAIAHLRRLGIDVDYIFQMRHTEHEALKVCKTSSSW